MILGTNLSLIEMFLLCFSGPQERKLPALLRGGQRGPVLPSEKLGPRGPKAKGAAWSPARMIRSLEISYRKENELTFPVFKKNKETAAVETDAGVRKHFLAPQS